MEAQYRTVVYFSMDHTLIEGPWEKVVFPRVCAEIAGKSGQELERVQELVRREGKRREEDPKCPATKAMDWDDIVHTVARSLDVELEANVPAIVLKHAGPPHSQILDNAGDVLAKLKSPHRALVVATKGLARYQCPILDALGLTHFFDDILTPDTNQALKKEEEFYGIWAHKGTLHIVVGDDIDDDVLAPHSFGFKTIWKPKNPEHRELGQERFAKRGVQPNAIIDSLEQVPDIVEGFERDMSLSAGSSLKSEQSGEGCVDLPLHFGCEALRRGIAVLP